MALSLTLVLLFLLPVLSQFAAANSEELGVKCVPSLNLVYTEEEGYVTADVAEDKQLVRVFGRGVLCATNELDHCCLNNRPSFSWQRVFGCMVLRATD